MLRKTLPSLVGALTLAGFFPTEAHAAFQQWAQVTTPNGTATTCAAAPSASWIDCSDNLMPGASNVSISGGGGLLWALRNNDNQNPQGLDNSQIWSLNLAPAGQWSSTNGWADQVFVGSSGGAFVVTKPTGTAPRGTIWEFSSGSWAQLPGSDFSSVAQNGAFVYACHLTQLWSESASIRGGFLRGTWSQFNPPFPSSCGQVAYDIPNANLFAMDNANNTGHIWWESNSAWHPMTTAICGGGSLNAAVFAVYGGTVYALHYHGDPTQGTVYTATTNSPCWSLPASGSPNNTMHTLGMDNGSGTLYGGDVFGNVWKLTTVPQ
jgi:hypothetical protein